MLSPVRLICVADSILIGMHHIAKKVVCMYDDEMGQMFSTVTLSVWGRMKALLLGHTDGNELV